MARPRMPKTLTPQLSDTEVDVLDSLAASLRDFHVLGGDAGRQFFASDGAPYKAARRLVSLGYAEARREAGGPDPSVEIVASVAGLLRLESEPAR